MPGEKRLESGFFVILIFPESLFISICKTRIRKRFRCAVALPPLSHWKRPGTCVLLKNQPVFRLAFAGSQPVDLPGEPFGNEKCGSGCRYHLWQRHPFEHPARAGTFLFVD